MSEPNGNGTSLLSVFTKARNWKRWTATNNEALLAIVADEDAEEYRMLALGFIRAFGNWTDGKPDPQDACLDPVTARRMNQADFAREIGVSRQTVSRWVERLEARNQLHDTGRGIYPVADPSKPSKWRKDSEQVSGSLGHFGCNYKKIQEEYFQQYPAKKLRLDELRAEKKAIEYEVLRYYRDRLRSLESGTNRDSEAQTPTESVPDSERAYIKERGRADSESDIGFPLRPEPAQHEGESSSSSSLPENPTTTTTMPLPERAQEDKDQETAARIGRAIEEETGQPPDAAFCRQLLVASRQARPDVYPEEIEAAIQRVAKIPRKESHLGLFLTAVPNSLSVPRPANPPPKTSREEAHPENDPANARWRAEQEAALADPKVPEQEKHLIRLCLGIES